MDTIADNESQYFIYVDTGGTFSDAVLVGPDGSIVTGKYDTTYGNLEECFFRCIENACRNAGLSIEGVLSRSRAVGYGTTIGTNIMVTGIGGPRLGFITTKGEEDRIFITRQRSAGLERSAAMHIIAAPKARPLVPRELVKGVTERVDCQGEEIIPLREDEVREAVKDLVDEKVEGIAVGLLWNFLDPAHERRIEEIIREMAPGVSVSLSSVVAPTVREYPRFISTIIDLHIGRPLRELLDKIEERLYKSGYHRPLLVLTAVGGVTQVKTVKPANTLHSGPVGGLAGVDFVRKVYDYKVALGSDVGGTSFDVSVSREEEEEFERVPVVGRYEVANPMREIATIGAGGGTIAWIESVTGTLRLGPQSAGSSPGPVCYGRGGTEPTVTDADVVMNRINPKYFLGGSRDLDVQASRRAIKEKIADPINVSVEDAAEAICAIIDGSMQALLKTTMAKKGVDPKETLLLAFGGAGPAHCAGYSKGLGFSRVLIPPYAACFSAFGASTSDIKHRYEASPFILMPNLPFNLASRRFDLDKITSMDQVPHVVVERFNRMFDELEKEAYAELESEGFGKDQATVRGEIMARYGGQLSEINVPCPVMRMNSVEDLRSILLAYENRYEETYGKEALAPGGGIEIMSITLTASAPTVKPQIIKYEYGGSDPGSALKEKRDVYFGGKWIPVDIYEMEKLRYGNVVEGPGIIEVRDSTVVIPSDRKVTMDEYHYMVLEYISEAK